MPVESSSPERPDTGPVLTGAGRPPSVARQPLASPSVTVGGRKTRPRARSLGPDLLIAGVTHAGATRLAAGLGRHPEVRLPVSRRIDHFAPLRFGRDPEPDLLDYADHFATWEGERYRLESSPVYFDGGPRLVDAVARAFPGLRVVVLLREPAERLWTGFVDKIRRGRLPRAMTYGTYVDRCLALRANDADRFEGNRYFRTLSGGFYVDHLPVWAEAFGDRIRVVFGEDLAADRQGVVGEVLRWLDLDPADAPAEPGDEDPGDPAGRWGRWPVLQRGAVHWRRPPAVDPAGRPVPRCSERDHDRVRGVYAESVGRLAERMRVSGQGDLPGWLAGS